MHVINVKEKNREKSIVWNITHWLYLFQLGNGKISCRKEINLLSENSSSKILTAIIGLYVKGEQSYECKYSHLVIM